MKVEAEILLRVIREEMKWRATHGLGLKPGEDVPLRLPDGRRLLAKGCRTRLRPMGVTGAYQVELTWEVLIGVDADGNEEPY